MDECRDMLEGLFQYATIFARETLVAAAHTIVARSLVMAIVDALMEWVAFLACNLFTKASRKVGIAKAFTLDTLSLSNLLVAARFGASLIFASIPGKSWVALTPGLLVAGHAGTAIVAFGNLKRIRTVCSLLTPSFACLYFAASTSVSFRAGAFAVGSTIVLAARTVTTACTWNDFVPLIFSTWACFRVAIAASPSTLSRERRIMESSAVAVTIVTQSMSTTLDAIRTVSGTVLVLAPIARVPIQARAYTLGATHTVAVAVARATFALTAFATKSWMTVTSTVHALTNARAFQTLRRRAPMFLASGTVPSRFALAYTAIARGGVRAFAIPAAIVLADGHLTKLSFPQRHASFWICFANAHVVLFVAIPMLEAMVQLLAVEGVGDVWALRFAAHAIPFFLALAGPFHTFTISTARGVAARCSGTVQTRKPMLAKTSTPLAVASPVPTAIGGAGQFCAVVARIAVATKARGRVVPVEDALSLHKARALFQLSTLFAHASRAHGDATLWACKGVDTTANGRIVRTHDTFTSSAARFPVRTDRATPPTKRPDIACSACTRLVVWTACAMATTYFACINSARLFADLVFTLFTLEASLAVAPLLLRSRGGHLAQFLVYIAVIIEAHSVPRASVLSFLRAKCSIVTGITQAFRHVRYRIRVAFTTPVAIVFTRKIFAVSSTVTRFAGAHTAAA